jgi:hypothetical protein
MRKRVGLSFAAVLDRGSVGDRPQRRDRPQRLAWKQSRRSRIEFGARLACMLLFGSLGSAGKTCVGGAAAADAKPQPAAERPLLLESPKLRLSLAPTTGAYELTDKRTGVTWSSNPRQPRLGTVVLSDGKTDRTLPLDQFRATAGPRALDLTHTLPGADGATLVVRFEILPDDETLQISAQSSDPRLRRLRLLDDALWVTDADRGSVLVPVRLGLLIPADSGKTFQHAFRTSGYEGCHAEMVGLFKAGSAALLTWHDNDSVFHLQSITERCPVPSAKQAVLPSLDLSPKSATLQIHLLGKATYGQLARAYRPVAKAKGYLVTWDEKLRGLARREALFGASNVKLWTCLNRRMNEESTQEESVRVEWTFDQAAQIAEHLRKDLELDRVLFILGGWTSGGYDCRHPDIMPAAPECGGNQGLADCARRVAQLGYTLGLHDNYQDMYRDAPSWGEQWLMKDHDGQPRKGGRWLGGRAYLTCAPKALELAQRPHNLPEVARLITPGAYFIDTTYAVDLQECFDPKHPLTRTDDLHWKQELSNYARAQFGIFGSECGREWAIPCSDFFEGLSGVSGGHYHNADLLDRLGATPLPVFEMIYHDCIQIYGKYGYRPEKATQYVLHHLLVGRPLNYHQVPPGLYWHNTARDESLRARPSVARFEPAGPHRFRITYRWKVEQPITGRWTAFVHFTNPNGRILFQGDYSPEPPVDEWKPGEMTLGPFEVAVPQLKPGPVDIRVGLFRPQKDVRATLEGQDDGECRYLVGRLQIRADGVAFEEVSPAAKPTSEGLFIRADNGWAEGLHPLDRFLKNTHEILSPLNRLSAQLLLSDYELLTPDARVRRSVFGDGRIEVVANLSDRDYTYRSKSWGDVVLPPDGFLAHAPAFLAFSAKQFQGLHYDRVPLFTLRSLDQKPLEQSARVRVYHGFGDPRLAWAGRTLEVPRQTVLDLNRKDAVPGRQ